MCSHSAVRTKQKKLESQNYIQQGCAGKDGKEYTKKRGIYKYISYIKLFKLLDKAYCIKLFSLFFSFCTACTTSGCSFIQVFHLSTFH